MQVNNSMLTNVIAPSTSSVAVYVTTTNTFGQSIAFDTKTDAVNLATSWVSGSALSGTPSIVAVAISSSSTGYVGGDPIYAGPAPSQPEMNSLGWYAQITINTSSLSTPSASSLAVDFASPSGFPVNFTIAVDAADPAQAEEVEVLVADGTNGPNNMSPLFSPIDDTVTVGAFAGSGAILDGSASALQNSPSAAGTLQALEDALDIDDYTASVGTPAEGYIDSITINSTDYDQGVGFTNGWIYGVYRGGNLVSMSQVVSPAVLPIVDDDQVGWLYIEYDSQTFDPSDSFSNYPTWDDFVCAYN
jgi:hypothetical protein